MTDDTAITDRMRKLAEETDNDMGGDTIVVDDMDIMATREMKQLINPEPSSDDDSAEEDSGCDLP